MGKGGHTFWALLGFDAGGVIALTITLFV